MKKGCDNKVSQRSEHSSINWSWAIQFFIATLLGVVSMAGEHVCAQTPPPTKEDPAVQALAATYYAGKYHVDTKQAQLRLSIQDQAAGIEDDLIKLLGDQYAGIWYDGFDGGRLKIGLTRLATAQSNAVRSIVAARGLAASADLVAVRYSEAELQGTRDSVRDKLQDMIDAARCKTGYSTKSNAAIVTALAKLSASEESRLQAVAQLPGVLVVRLNVPSLEFDFLACGVTGCDPPMRGGREIKFGNGAGCTAAFIARDRSIFDQWWALTAGHCTFLHAAPWSATNEAGTTLLMGSSGFYNFAGGPGLDAGIASIDWNSTWMSPLPIAAVVVANGPGATYNPNYPIKYTSYTSVGQIVCRTGRTTGSECGEVSEIGDDETGKLSDGHKYTVHNMVEVDMCAAKAGDSGGPVFKINRAYGIFSGVQSFKPFSCYEIYQLIRTAEDGLNVSTLTQ